MKCNICKQDISNNDRGTHLVEQHGLTATIAAVIVFLEDRIASAEERIKSLEEKIKQ